jgi:hypothetical protein
MDNNTGSNQALGVLMGYGHVKAHPSTMAFCPVTSYDSSVMSRNTARAGQLREKVFSAHAAQLFPVTKPALAG